MASVELRKSPNDVARQIAECMVDGEPLRVALPAARGPVDPPFVRVLEASEGRLRVDTAHCDREDAGAIAAAVVNKAWAWDESERVVVELGGGFVTVEPRFDGRRWQATIVERG
jgi:hypothetical protein